MLFRSLYISITLSSYAKATEGHCERETVIGSNPSTSLMVFDLFSLDKYIKEYLASYPELSIGVQLKIILRELLTRDLILQLREFMSYLGITSFKKAKYLFPNTR